MTTPAAEDFATIAARLREIEAERRANLATDSADTPQPTLQDLLAAVEDAG